MKKLVALNQTSHKNIKFNPQRAILAAAKRQTITITASEISRAASTFPVFVMPNVGGGRWSIATLTSFAPSTNVFLQGENWEATYIPNAVKTYPFSLINAENGGYTVGIDEESESLSTEDGEPLFEANGQASQHVSQVTKILDAELQNTIDTVHFIEHIEKLKLLKAVDLIVRYDDETSQNMTGLHTVDEDNLNLISGDELEALNKKGYLVQLHAMLISLYQINLLIQKNNLTSGFDKIKNVKFQITRDQNT